MNKQSGPRPSGPKKQPRTPGPRPPQIPGKTAGFWILLVFLVFLVYQMIYIDRTSVFELNYSAFQEQVLQGHIKSIEKTGLDVHGELNEKITLTVTDGSLQDVDRFHTRLLNERDDFADWILATNSEASLAGVPPKRDWWAMVSYYIPFVLILVLWLFFLRQMQGGGNKAFSFGKSKAKLFNMDKPEVNFEDVAGCDEAKYELQEIIDFLRAPGRPDSQGRPAGRITGHGQDPAGPRRGRRGRCALLQHERIGFRGDVRGRGRQPRA